MAYFLLDDQPEQKQSNAPVIRGESGFINRKIIALALLRRREFLARLARQGGAMVGAMALLNMAGCASEDAATTDFGGGGGSTGEQDLPALESGAYSTENDQIRIELTALPPEISFQTGDFFWLPAEGVIFVRTGENSVAAFSSFCPHLGCDVEKFSGSRLVCPCHGSEFDTNGQVMKGPAGEGLRDWPAEIVNEEAGAVLLADLP